MSSKSQSGVPEAEETSEESDLEKTGAQPSHENWEKFLESSDLREAYGTVIEIYENNPYLQDPTVKSTDQEVFMPDGEAYDGMGESIKALREKIDEDTLVVAFGFHGDDLPNYQELLDPEMNSEGNWWDRPDEVDADFLVDRETYSGAVNVPGYDSRHLLSDGDTNREVYFFSQD